DGREGSPCGPHQTGPLPPAPWAREENNNTMAPLGVKPYSCPHCEKSFPQLRNLKDHQKYHHTGKKAFTCSQCGKGFVYMCHLRVHMQCHTGERPFSCSQCGKSFVYLCNLKSHQQYHTGEKPYSCSQCGKSFSLQSGLKKHRVIHSAERPYHCMNCGNRFYSRSVLKRHKAYHTGERPYQCTDCGKRFIARADLKKHEQIHSSGTDKSFSCKYCGKGFGREFGLSVHMRSHKKVKIKGTYQCPKCPKKFQYPSALSVHTRDSHEKKKPCSSVKEMSDSVNTHPKVYSCYVCHKKYTSAHSLRDHGRIHTGERPYPCNQCGQRFRVKQFLILHLRKAHADVYGGEESSGDLSWTEPVEEPMANGAEQQPAIKSKGKDDRQAKANSKRQQMTETDGLFQCTVCKMLLSSQVSLVQHFRIHTGEKPPSCDMWQKSPLPSRLDQPLEVCPPGKEVVVPEVCEAIRDNGRT
uniref:C2H2-type domain-containing protein n=1 Tax=Hucho hucho TaxID=62062 RepID=A0A4W5KU21_9TELE